MILSCCVAFVDTRLQVNIVPVIAKADTMTPEECAAFKKKVGFVLATGIADALVVQTLRYILRVSQSLKRTPQFRCGFVDAGKIMLQVENTRIVAGLFFLLLHGKLLVNFAPGWCLFCRYGCLWTPGF